MCDESYPVEWEGKSYSSHVWLTPRRVWNYWIRPMFVSSPAKLACPVYSATVFNVESTNLHSQAGWRFYLANQYILNASSFTSHGFHYVSGDKGLLLFHFSYSRVGALLWRLVDFSFGNLVLLVTNASYKDSRQILKLSCLGEILYSIFPNQQMYLPHVCLFQLLQ